VRAIFHGTRRRVIVKSERRSDVVEAFASWEKWRFEKIAERRARGGRSVVDSRRRLSSVSQSRKEMKGQHNKQQRRITQEQAKAGEGSVVAAAGVRSFVRSFAPTSEFR